MNIAITESVKPRGSHWQVQMGQHVVSFRSEAEALAFVETLQARLRAPHSLPTTNRRSV